MAVASPEGSEGHSTEPEGSAEGASPEAASPEVPYTEERLVEEGLVEAGQGLSVQPLHEVLAGLSQGLPSGVPVLELVPSVSLEGELQGDCWAADGLGR